MNQFFPLSPWIYNLSINTPVHTPSIKYNGPDTNIFIIAKQSGNYVIPPYLDVYVNDNRAAVSLPEIVPKFGFLIRTGDVFNFRTRFADYIPGSTYIAVSGTFDCLLYDNPNLSGEPHELTFNVSETEIVGPSNNISISPGIFLLDYICTKSILKSTVLGLNVQNLNLNMSIISSPGGYNLQITPVSQARPFTVTIYYPLFSIIDISGLENVIQILPAQPGYTYTIKLTVAEIYYDLYVPNDVNQFRSQIRIPNTAFQIIGGKSIGLVTNTTSSTALVTNTISSTALVTNTILASICSLDDVPSIWIENIDADVNIGELKFTITDTEIYDETYCRSDAQIICPQNNIYRSTIIKYPQVQSVVKGNVCGGSGPNSIQSTQCQTGTKSKQTGTLVQKAIYLSENFDTGLSTGDFYNALAFYSCVRYILSGVLFGEYSEKFLEQQYYQYFLSALSKSRFSKFTIIFTTPQTLDFPNGPVVVDFSNYYRYYIYGSGSGVVDCDAVSTNVPKYPTSGNIDGCKIAIKYGRT